MATIYPDLAGKRAIVTACTAGIGKACVEALVAQGASVALLSRNMDKLHALQETCSHGNKLHMVQMCDMTQPDAVRTAVRTAIAALGGLDVLVINTPGHNEATFAARGHNDTRACAIEHYTINTLASMAAYEAAREAFLANTPTPGGAVVCISSCAAQFCSVQDAQYGYSGAKAALEQWAQGTAVADGPRGIRVNCVRPGVTVTAVWDAARVAMGAGMCCCEGRWVVRGVRGGGLGSMVYVLL